MIAVLLIPLTGSQARAGYDRDFASGSLIIPMDLAYQDHGLFQAYGLVYQLLRQGVTVYWVIDDNKVWHHAPCDTPGDLCTWDCAEEGSGVQCPYPTGSPDFTTGSTILWDDQSGLGTGETIASHGYRGGPFVIDAAQAATARAIVDAWNDRDAWVANPWAERSTFAVVSVHESTAAFEGHVQKEMIAAPTIAVFSDGNEDIATGYLRAAGIPQSNGSEFPEGKCRADGDCGPGTDNPDMLTVVSVMGDMGTCDAPNTNHRNGALFNAAGTPAYCQIMSMHWGVNDRETVECDGGRCPDSQAECSGETFTYHGHEVVAEVRQFLSFPTHFFAECQAVNAYENTVPNPEWPYLDDEARLGHFLTTTGMPPDCPCDAGGDGFECVVGGCDLGARDCCLPRDAKERGAGFLIADRPDGDALQVLNAQVPYNQMDGAFGTVGGSEPAYNLSSFLGTAYKNDLDVTFITGPSGPGDQDVWMTGFVDGECDLVRYDEFATPGECNLGKVSYLGGHRYSTDLPLSDNADSHGTRLFLNALFEADCVTGGLVGMSANVVLGWTGEAFLRTEDLPIDGTYAIRFSNTGGAGALDAVLTVTAPPGLSIASTDTEATIAGETVTWPLGTIDAGASDTRTVVLSFAAEGTFALDAMLHHGDGPTEVRATYTIRVAGDRDGDGVPDDEDSAPDDRYACGDTDMDGCDDCSTGSLDLDADCTGAAASVEDGGCGCRVMSRSRDRAPTLLLLALLSAALRRARR